MNTLVVLSVVAVLVGVASASNTEEEAMKQKIIAAAKACGKEYGNDISDDCSTGLQNKSVKKCVTQQEKCFMQCLLKSTSVVDDTGSVTSEFLTLMDKNATADEKPKIKKCLKSSSSSDPCSKSYEIMLCMENEGIKSPEDKE